MNRAHFELLREVLLDVIRESRPFDMQYWARETSCGTVACAAGSLALDSRGQAEGLRIVQAYGHGYIVYDALDAEVEDPNFCTTYAALDAFFDVDEPVTERLFDPYSYRYNATQYPITPADVIRALDEILAAPDPLTALPPVNTTWFEHWDLP